jgi:hypothetical protein
VPNPTNFAKFFLENPPKKAYKKQQTNTHTYSYKKYFSLALCCFPMMATKSFVAHTKHKKTKNKNKKENNKTTHSKLSI